jgi:hypothetical protein
MWLTVVILIWWVDLLCRPIVWASVETNYILLNLGHVWHNSASPVELFFRKQLHEQLHEQGRAMFLQLHRVLNSVRESFQRRWPESWAESWSFGYSSCEAAREAANEAVPNRPLVVEWISEFYLHFGHIFNKSRCDTQRTHKHLSFLKTINLRKY